MSGATGFILTTVLGWIAFLFGVFGCVPQSIRVCKTKDTQSISLSMYIIYCVGCVLWIIWSIGFLCETLDTQASAEVSKALIYASCLPTLFLNAICGVLAAIVLTIKLKNFIGARKLHISEREYTERKYSKTKGVKHA